MSAGEIERLNYYREQALSVDDFQDEQRYHRDMRRRHNLAPHTWGIVTGLELIETAMEGQDGVVEVTLRPGFAVDGYGREIVVQDPCKLDQAAFVSFRNQTYREVWIAFDERRTRKAFGADCEPGSVYSRVVESYKIVIEPGARITDGVIVAGKKVAPPPPPAAGTGDVTTPDDNSVPHQELPADDDDDRRWLVRIGSVLWDGAGGVFRPAGARLSEERRYAGAVAAEVLAPAGRIRIRDRNTPTDPAKDSPDLAAVEGTLRVDGLLTTRAGIQVDGDKIDLRDDNAGNDPAFEIYRKDDAAVRVRIGDDDGGEHRFAVGTGTVDEFKEQLIVRDDGRTDVKGRLDVAGHVRLNERIDLRDEQGTNGTGPVRILRVKNDVERNDVRVVIGSSDDGGDTFQVGILDGGDFEQKLEVKSSGDLRAFGPARIGGNLFVDGGDLEFRLAGGGTDTDPMKIGRVHVASDENTMRLTIGDNQGGGDKLEVGPLPPGGFAPCLTVVNNGNAQVANDLTVGGNLNLGGVVMMGSARMPLDVVPGSVTVDAWSDGTGSVPFEASSRLASVSDAFAIVVPTYIETDFTAGESEWEFSVGSKQRINARTFRFRIGYRLLNADLVRADFLIFFIP